MEEAELEAPLVRGDVAEWSDSTRIVMDLAASLILFAVAAGGGALPRWLLTRANASGLQERSLAFSLGNMLSAGGVAPHPAYACRGGEGR